MQNNSKDWDKLFLVIMICVAQVLVQIGAFFWPVLLPDMMPLWSLSNSEAGWITAIFYGAYMLSVPVLVTLTDRLNPKSIYLFQCRDHDHWSSCFWYLRRRILVSHGDASTDRCRLAGTYMTGLKLLADLVNAQTLSRARLDMLLALERLVRCLLPLVT